MVNFIPSVDLWNYVGEVIISMHGPIVCIVPSHDCNHAKLLNCSRTLEQSMEARNREGIEFSFVVRARQATQSWRNLFLGSLEV
jgi:hypothetical protein